MRQTISVKVNNVSRNGSTLSSRNMSDMSSPIMVPKEPQRAMQSRVSGAEELPKNFRKALKSIVLSPKVRNSRLVKPKEKRVIKEKGPT